MNVQKITLSTENAQALLDRLKSSLTDEDYQIIKGLIDTHLLLNQAVQQKSTSIKRLLKMIFGAKTEKSTANRKKRNSGKGKKTRKAKGHGRNGAGSYTGAEKQKVKHQTLNHCDPCPDCQDGRLYRMQTTGVVVRITGSSPLQGIIYEQEKLRCNICGKIFTADLPPEAGSKKYDAKAAAMVAVLRYGCGFPLNRLAKLQAALGVPLPASTAWEVTEDQVNIIHPIFPELINHAAQGDIVHNDDTTMKILEVMAEINTVSPKPSRTGIFTSGILSLFDNHKIALFFTGQRHAGENLATILAQRQQSLDPPIQMCDALSRNTSEEFQTLLANCLTHGRRNFVDVVEHFPDECEYVLKTLGSVYHHDAVTLDQNMTPGQRLQYHQLHSKPLMDDLLLWLQKQFDDKKVEPNSGLGKAIKYMIKHWEELTLFLRVEKAPLDNNICERALKMAILHRKNSLFYKTEHGAYVGDVFMSLIHTCFLNKVNPFEYLTALQENREDLSTHPHRWLPWNYQENASLSSACCPPLKNSYPSLVLLPTR
jgi:transposase